MRLLKGRVSQKGGYFFELEVLKLTNSFLILVKFLIHHPGSQSDARVRMAETRDDAFQVMIDMPKRKEFFDFVIESLIIESIVDNVIKIVRL